MKPAGKISIVERVAAPARSLLFVSALVAALGLGGQRAQAKTIFVDTLSGAGSGGCSLAEAIDAANNNVSTGGCPSGDLGEDTIAFLVAGTILVETSGDRKLDDLESDLIIDGRTAPGYAPHAPTVKLEMTNGTNRGVLTTIVSNVTNVKIYGLEIGRSGGGGEGVFLKGDGFVFEENIVHAQGSDGLFLTAGAGAIQPSSIKSNWFGIDPANEEAGNDGNGIRLNGGAINVVVEDNVISASTLDGIEITGSSSITENHVIRNNLIGTDVTGTSCTDGTGVVLGNERRGIEISSAARGILVEGNVVSCNGRNAPNETGDGIFIAGGSANQQHIIRNNWVGTNAALAMLGNGDNGIVIRDSVNQTHLIGNVIAYNGLTGTNDCETNGILVRNSAAEIEISQNSIFSNVGIAIDLATQQSTCGNTSNDSGDSDSGPNDFLNYPDLTGPNIAIVDGMITIDGSYDGTGSRRFEFFCNSEKENLTAFGEAKDYIGTDTVLINSPNQTFVSGPYSVTTDCFYVTATAIDPTGEDFTSEVSVAVPTRRVCVDDATGFTPDTGCGGATIECDDDTPLFEKCVVCQDDAAAGAIDGGCGVQTPACDDSGATPVCVECLVDADCPVATDACNPATNRCIACIDSGSGATVDSGCTEPESECDDTMGAEVCVVCQNDAPAGSIDGGCSAATPACDTSGAPTCVECLSNGDCADGNVCDPGSRTCKACVDDGSGASIDNGCLEPTSECDATPGAEMCVVCEDDAPAGNVDGGCTGVTPACNGSACVECLVDDDCPGMAVCDTMESQCVSCVDSGDGVMDSGCMALPGSGNANACDGFDCVDCTADADCDANEFCDQPTHTCVACMDDATGASADTGCAEPTSECSVGMQACVVCEDDAAAGAIDGGCSAATPACSNGACVECAADADCSGGTVCDLVSSTCVACTDSGTGATVDNNCAEPTSECNDSALPMCVVCEDDAGAGLVDGGCGGSTPACDESGASPVCVACLATADCIGGEFCDVGLRLCAACLDGGDGAVDNGCSGPAGTGTANACLGSGATAACVDCTHNADCNAGEVCNPTTHTCEPPCSDTGSGATMDTGCGSVLSECDDSVPGSEVCVVCEDDAAPGNVDGGCNSETPICDDSGATPLCVECITDNDCNVGDVCNASSECETPMDSDGDTVEDENDPDDDNDGLLDIDETGDSDGDGVPDRRDLDSDNDGIPDLWENGDRSLDTNGDGQLTSAEAAFGDADGDGLLAPFDGDDNDAEVQTTGMPQDADGDGLANTVDRDSDGDGICDGVESLENGELPGGAADFCEVAGFTDANNNGYDDSLEAEGRTVPNSDGDANEDYLDTDSDGDTIVDAIEGHDVDGDGQADVAPVGNDFDGDGLDDAYDGSQSGTLAPLPDSDGDEVPDFRDADDDGDGVSTANETGDSDNNGVPDYLQRNGGGGGGGCGIITDSATSTTPTWLLLLGLAVLIRRRRR